MLLADISCFESDTKEDHCELASWTRLYAFVGGKKKKDDVVIGLYCLVAQYSFRREEYFGILSSLKTHTDQFVESIKHIFISCYKISTKLYLKQTWIFVFLSSHVTVDIEMLATGW